MVSTMVRYLSFLRLAKDFLNPRISFLIAFCMVEILSAETLILVILVSKNKPRKLSGNI